METHIGTQESKTADDAATGDRFRIRQDITRRDCSQMIFYDKECRVTRKHKANREEA